MTDAEDLPKRHGRWNWWKIGFFLMLFLFEGAREWAVIASYDPPKIAVSDHVARFQTLVSATGRWKRMNEGTDMVPGAVRITCWQDEGRCYELNYHIIDGYAGTPEMDVFEAKFSDEAVTYENDVPECARYRVRIDLMLKKVIVTRDRKDTPANSNCRLLEPRVELTLGSGYQPIDPTKDHFVPVFWLVRKLLGS